MPIQLSIVTPTHEALAMECDEVIAPGSEGEVGFLPGHVPLITALTPGVLTVIEGHRRRVFAVSSGFAEIKADAVRVLTSACEEADTINIEEARSALEDAEENLANLSPSNPGYAEQRLRFHHNRARLEAHARRPD